MTNSPYAHVAPKAREDRWDGTHVRASMVAGNPARLARLLAGDTVRDEGSWAAVRGTALHSALLVGAPWSEKLCRAKLTVLTPGAERKTATLVLTGHPDTYDPETRTLRDLKTVSTLRDAERNASKWTTQLALYVHLLTHGEMLVNDNELDAVSDTVASIAQWDKDEENIIGWWVACRDLFPAPERAVIDVFTSQNLHEDWLALADVQALAQRNVAETTDMLASMLDGSWQTPEEEAQDERALLISGPGLAIVERLGTLKAELEYIEELYEDHRRAVLAHIPEGKSAKAPGVSVAHVAAKREQRLDMDVVRANLDLEETSIDLFMQQRTVVTLNEEALRAWLTDKKLLDVCSKEVIARAAHARVTVKTA